MVVHAVCSTPMNVNGKTQLPQEELPEPPLPDPLPLPEVVVVVVVAGEGVVDPVDPGGGHVVAPLIWESIQALKWLTSA